MSAVWRAHWLQGAGLPVVALSFRAVFPAFCLLSCFAPDALPANMAIFRILRGFLEGFICLVWVCVILVLCVACVAFVRVYS